MSVFNLYLKNLRTKGDIQEHMGILFGLATTCEHVVEIGFRTGISTTAFLASGAKVTSYDILKCHPFASNLKKLAGDKFTFIQGDSRKVEIPECDMLFIDSYHSGAQLHAELVRHADSSRRLIVMHDTQKFGAKGQDGKPGLRSGINKFLDFNHHWWVKLNLGNNNGLTIMERHKL